MCRTLPLIFVCYKIEKRQTINHGYLLSVVFSFFLQCFEKSDINFSHFNYTWSLRVCLTPAAAQVGAFVSPADSNAVSDTEEA